MPWGELSLILKNAPAGRPVLLYRSEEERLFLEGWLSRESSIPRSHEKKNEPAAPADPLNECTACPSATGRRRARGTGANGVMILLNAPTMMLRREMDLLRKESADLLRNMINAIKLDLDQCYVTNLIKCDSTDPVVHPSDMLPNCVPVFVRELETVKPRIVIVMGDIKPIQKVVALHGDIRWFTIHHPVTIVRNPDLKRSAWNTLRMVMEKLPGQSL